MKFILSLLLFITFSQVHAQQNNANDALLLDLYQNQKYLEAAKYLKSTYPEPVTDMKILSRLAYTYQMAGKLPDAEAYYQRILDKDPANIPVMLNLANINLKRENNNKAIDYFQRIIALDSSNFTVYKQLGKLYMEQYNIPAQIQYFQKANKLNPEDDEVAADLSNTLVSLKLYKPAQKVLATALAADSLNMMLLRAMLKLNFSQKKYAATIKAGEQMVTLGDTSYAVVSKVGEAYFMLKNYQCCIETFALMPDIFQSESSYYFTAESYKALKNNKMAVDLFVKTLHQAISNNTPLYYSEMADTYNEMHQVKTAISNYQKSLFFKDDGMIYYTLANLYDTSLKDKKNALKYYKKYIDSKPPVKEQQYIDYVQSRITQLKK